MTGSSDPTSRSPLRVLFLATYFPKPGNTLMGTWALSQAQALRRQGVDMRVVSFTSWVPKWAALTGGAKAYANCPERHQWGDLSVEYPRWLLYQAGPPKRWAYPNPRRQLAIAWASAKRHLRAIVREHRPDVIYAHHTGVNGYLAWRLKREFGIPYVITDHDFGEIADCEKFPGRREVYQPIVDNVSTIVCVASRMERDLNRIFPAANARTVQNGTDPIPPQLWQTPRPSEIDGKLVIFSVGAFYERKGFPLLIRSFAQIASKHPSAVLRIAGDGDTRADVDRAVRESGVADRIQLLGFQPHDRVMQEMVWSELFALVGWDEPFATVFIEAMAAGKPIVWAGDGGINDVLESDVHGYRVPPRDVDAAAAALDKLLSDPAARNRMGAATRELHRSRLTWDVNARTMIKIFEAAVAGIKYAPSGSN